MADDVNALAQEYFDYLLTAWPTWGHLMGNYENAARFDDASRAGEDEEIRVRRAFADRAEAIPVDGLSAQDLITREMIAFDGRRNADILDARFAEFAVDPIFGQQARLPVLIPKFPIPDATVAEAMIEKIRGIATNFRDMSDRVLEGVARKRTPAAFAIDDTVAQIDRWLADADRRGSAARSRPSPTGVADADAWRARLRDVIEDDVRPAMAHYRDTIRDQVRPHARDDDHVGLTWLADGDDAYGRMIRYHTTLTAFRPRDPRDRSRADREARWRVPRARSGGPRDERRARDLPPAARRSRPPSHERRRHRDRVQGGVGQGDRGDGRLVRHPAQGRLRRRGGPVRGDRVLLPAGEGRQPAAASSS